MTRRPANLRLRALIIAAVVCIVATAHSARAAAVQACSPAILSCGCTITKRGYYQVDASLSSGQGLTSRGECVAIKASNVVLNLAASQISGPFEGGAGTGQVTVGVSVEPGASNCFIEGAGAVIEGWTIGLEVQGSQNVIEFFDANDNDVAGVALQHANANNITDFIANDNGEFGVWIQQSSNNQLNCSNADNNGYAGVYSGCPASEAVRNGCKGGGTSSGNRLFNLMALNNAAYGVVLDSSSRRYMVTNVGARGNPAADLSDQNNGCGTDSWFDNSFTSANQACIN